MSYAHRDIAMSLKTARQLVLHGHVKVNGKTVNIPSFEVKPGSVVSLEPGNEGNTNVKLSLDNASPQIHSAGIP